MQPRDFTQPKNSVAVIQDKKTVEKPLDILALP